ncbi:homeobox even-skipped homolog protein 2-like [Athalia rosae]|uniref:homeobox even-skipped homolog protein 2-like n=1 Tax=Athalia rosae TaxID=37344 RepID=UPI00203407FE|nr:homeobox even-skipped homolog protein 2-like [Athalia rosae]
MRNRPSQRAAKRNRYCRRGAAAAAAAAAAATSAGGRNCGGGGGGGGGCSAGTTPCTWQMRIRESISVPCVQQTLANDILSAPRGPPMTPFNVSRPHPKKNTPPQRDSKCDRA